MAEAAGLGVLLNRPLNAMRGREPLRLAPFPGHHGIDVEGALQAALSRVMEMESRAPEQQVTPAENLAWGHILRDNINRLSDIVSWKETRDARILPRFIPAMEALAKERELRDWSLPYRTAVEDLFAAFTRFVEARSAATARTLSAELHRLCPELRSSPTLSQKVLRIYRSVPGAGPILVGMRRASYVRDVLGAEPPIAPRVALELLAHFRVVR
jgi:hypothetical protein